MANLGQLKAVFSLHFTHDTDGDGLPDLTEHAIGSNPYNPLTTNKTIPDAWIYQHLGHIPNIFQSFDLNAANPGGGGTILETFLTDTDPNQPYGQNLPVWTAANSGKTNSADPPAPPVSRQRSVVIPAGESALLLVAIASEEFHYYTDPATSNEFNDILTWEIVPSSGDTLDGILNVNQFHGQWLSALDNQQYLPGMSNVIHYAHVEVLQAPPEQELVLNITVSAQNVADNDLASDIAVGLLPVEVVPDYNRDGMINDEDRGKATEETPFFFWVNNDDDGNSDPEMQDILEANVDNGDMEVNNVRDLVDFFPVQLRIQELLEVLPPAEHSYKISHPDGAFHFIEMPSIHPDSSPEAQGAGSYLRNSAVADEAVAGQMKDTAGEGAELSPGFLDACLEERGILLFEAISETQNSFELVISKKNGGDEVVRIRRALPVEIVTNPEAYYWRLNLRPASDGQNVGDAEPPANAKFLWRAEQKWTELI